MFNRRQYSTPEARLPEQVDGPNRDLHRPLHLPSAGRAIHSTATRSTLVGRASRAPVHSTECGRRAVYPASRGMTRLVDLAPPTEITRQVESIRGRQDERPDGGGPKHARERRIPARKSLHRRGEGVPQSVRRWWSKLHPRGAGGWQSALLDFLRNAAGQGVCGRVPEQRRAPGHCGSRCSTAVFALLSTWKGSQEPLAVRPLHYRLAATLSAPPSRPSPTGGLRPVLTTASLARAVGVTDTAAQPVATEMEPSTRSTASRVSSSLSGQRWP